MSDQPSITQQAQGLALVLAAAARMGLPAPHRISLDDISGADIVLSLNDLRDWAQWADAPITEGDPSEYMPGRWAVTHKAKGTIYDLPVTLSAVEFGVMVEPDAYHCEKCGAHFGSSGGFVPDGDTSSDWYETELSRHIEGACVGSVVAL